MAGGRITLPLLVVAALVVVTAVALDLFPEFTSELLARVMTGDGGHGGHDMGGER